MALIEASLIWIAYAAAIVVLLIISSVFVVIYQKPSERSFATTTVCIFTISALLATILLLPVDVALVSATVKSKAGVRKDWADQNTVDSILFQVKVVYYTLYSLDALLCLLVVPFTYFLVEEYDEREAEEGTQTPAMRLWGAFKYTIAFILLVVVLFLVGFFVPVANKETKKHRNLDYFKDLLSENHGERALTFALGLLMTLGTILYFIYTASGLAILPVSLIKSAPSISAPTLAANTSADLELNRERQRQLEGLNEGSENGLNARDRRELDALVREERTLVRRERVAAEASAEGRGFIIRTWTKIEAILRPFKLIFGLLLLVIALVIWVSMLLTGIDKAKNSVCKHHCGYLLGHVNIFQPVNWVFVMAAKVFPVDYIVYLLLVLLFFGSSVVGIATVGIRFLWVTIFSIRRGKTSPQAILMATVLLALIILALNYSLSMMVAPQYSTYGPQRYCDRSPRHPGEQPDCSKHKKSIKYCTEVADNPAARDICTPSVVSTFLNRITVNFPFFGVVTFWCQFVFLAVYLVVAVTILFRTPKLDTDTLDEDLEDEEEEGLLATTGRRFNATWQDITGRAQRNNPGNSQQNYGATD